MFMEETLQLGTEIGDGFEQMQMQRKNFPGEHLFPDE